MRQYSLEDASSLRMLAELPPAVRLESSNLILSRLFEQQGDLPRALERETTDR